MKLIKKIISFIVIAIVLCIGLFACKNNYSKEIIEKESSDSNMFDLTENNSNDINDSQDSDLYISEWIEIYSITYSIVGNGVTYKSHYRWTFSEKEEINKEEYDTIDSKWKRSSSSFSTYVDMTTGKEAVNGNEFEKDKYYYSFNNNYPSENEYYKVLCTGLKPIYILIRYCTNGDIELQLENGLFRIRPAAYVIQFFDDINALSN